MGWVNFYALLVLCYFVVGVKIAEFCQQSMSDFGFFSRWHYLLFPAGFIHRRDKGWLDFHSWLFLYFKQRNGWFSYQFFMGLFWFLVIIVNLLAIAKIFFFRPFSKIKTPSFF